MRHRLIAFLLGLVLATSLHASAQTTREQVNTDSAQTLSNKTLTSPTITGTVAGSATYSSPIMTFPTIAGSTGVGARLVLQPTHADGYGQISFYPEQGAIQDTEIVAHKCLSGTDCLAGNLHRHLTIYSSPSIGAAPVARLVLDYGVPTAQFLLSRTYLDFDTSAAPGAGGGYAEQIVLANNKFIKSWNAANTNVPNIFGLNGGNTLEIGSSSIITEVILYPGSLTNYFTFRTTGDLTLRNNKHYRARNAADSTDVSLIGINSSNQVVLANEGQDVNVGAQFIHLTGVTQANLGTPANGTIAYCSDCTIANPCAGSGTGALAKRLAGVWVCN